MTDKRIKNEKWYVKDIISRIRNQEITKPHITASSKKITQPYTARV